MRKPNQYSVSRNGSIEHLNSFGFTVQPDIDKSDADITPTEQAGLCNDFRRAIANHTPEKTGDKAPNNGKNTIA